MTTKHLARWKCRCGGFGKNHLPERCHACGVSLKFAPLVLVWHEQNNVLRWERRGAH